MKNLVIIGVPRAGKSTLSVKCAQKLAMAGVVVSVIPGDIFVAGYRAMAKKSWAYKLFWYPVRHIFPAYYRRLIERRGHEMTLAFLRRSTWEEWGKTNRVHIYEGVNLSVGDVVKTLNTDNFKIVAVGYPNITAAQKFKNIRKHDVNKYTKRYSDAVLMDVVEKEIRNSRKLAQECKKYGLLFLDTSKDYEKTLSDFADNVVDFLKN